MRAQEAFAGMRVRFASPPQIEGTVLAIVGDEIRVKWDNGRMMVYKGRESTSWLVPLDTPAPPPIAATRDFPHKCPQCGEKAYVGFLKIEHANHYSNGVCP